MMNRPFVWLALLASSLALSAGAATRSATPPPCKPCGEWKLDPAASTDVAATLESALATYKPPRPRRMRASPGDIAGESEAEFLDSLDRMPGPEDRPQLRVELLRLLQPPPLLTVRQDRNDIVIEAEGGPTRRVTPGEPHARVDALGTARIESRWRSGALAIEESYRRRTSNRETYALDAPGRLKVTRSVTRPGLSTVTVQSSYIAR